MQNIRSARRASRIENAPVDLRPVFRQIESVSIFCAQEILERDCLVHRRLRVRCRALREFENSRIDFRQLQVRVRDGIGIGRARRAQFSS